MNIGWLFIAGIRLLPRKRLSRFVRWLAGYRSRWVVRRFAALAGVNVAEAEKPLEAYDSVLDLFTRRLKPGLRPIDAQPDVLVSPVDATVGPFGAIDRGTLIQAKGHTYTVRSLLADPPADLQAGGYCTLYLAPGDYHRVHAPVGAEILGYTYVPGDLFPVNAASVRYTSHLYTRNERVIAHLRTPIFGRVDVVMVGATNVGRIRLIPAPELVTNTGATKVQRHEWHPPLEVEQGAELGVFELGSTVILVTEQALDFGSLALRSRIRMGEALGRGAPL